MNLVLGCFSIGLLVMLRYWGYPPGVLLSFLIVGLTATFSGDYLLNPFGLPVSAEKQEMASDIGLICYGFLYLQVAVSRMLHPGMFSVDLPFFLQPIWVRRGLATVGIILIAAGIYGVYKLHTEGLPVETAEAAESSE